MSIAKWIDHTLLKVDSRCEDIRSLCQEAIDLSTCSVCVNPYWVAMAHDYLKDTTVKVCSVVGFPLGSTYPSVKLNEAELALAHGAEEIDMVMNVGLFRSGDYQRVFSEIQELSMLVHNINASFVVKVIVQSVVLDVDEKKRVAAMVVDSGADFLKTSTGFVKNDHLLEDVKLFIDVLPKGFKVKAAGGIRDYQMAKHLISLGVSRIGASSTRKIVEEEKSALLD
jgi:deoxyribose-phosphate aldolase